MSKPVIVMVCGLPGSGKSTFSQKIAEEIDATVFSSDALREEMFGDVNEQSRNNELFAELRRRIKECLKSGKNAVYDATNVSSKRRRAFLCELDKIDCEKRCVIMATPYEQCIKNNASRDRKVPEKIINKSYRSWHTPYWFEGWDDIEIVYWEDGSPNKQIQDWLANYMDYDQHNPHHNMTLGEHCTEVGNQYFKYSLLSYAGYLHDVGKPSVRFFRDGVAHYYNHENCGAYEALFFYSNGFSVLDVSILVNLHMTPYSWEKDNDENLRDKYKKMWGEKLYNNVMELHRVDKVAH